MPLYTRSKRSSGYLMTKKNLTIKQIKELLLKKGFILKKKKFPLGSDTKNFLYTCLGSLMIIVFFFVSPIIIGFKKNLNIVSIEIKNESKSNFIKVLDGQVLETGEKTDKGLNTKNLFEDIINFEETSNNTVRLSAATIEQLFEETEYSLKNVRETKLVKPIALSLLPEEIKKIENTKRRKNLFIQIILPLILEENNKIKQDRIKLFSILNRNNNSKIEKKWLNYMFKRYGVLKKDLSTLKIRMDEIPVSLAIAQAAKETGWGTSRFALEGNALFGQWTWSGEGIKPAGSDSDSTHKVMKFKILKASVRAYQRNLNTHSSYRNFRKVRAQQRDNKKKLNSLILVDYLDKYAETGKEYTKILKQIIKQNDLTDFDDVKLLPSSIDLKTLI
jgi:Bax protein